MNYELAKKLKDAGFPQEVGKNPYYNHYWNFNEAVPEQGWYLDDENLAYKPEHTIYIPTLSELIEACGDEFKQLVKRSVGLNPFYQVYSIADEIVAEGPTPEEAVANLWLAINKKTTE